MAYEIKPESGDNDKKTRAKTQSKTKKKHAGGRPSKYQSIDLAEVEKLSGLGLIDTQIADFIGISKTTLNNYKQKPEFLDSLKRGKIKADAEVALTLYKKATGYTRVEKRKIKRGDDKGKTVEFEEYYAPDTTAIIFWLKNRQFETWRDKQEIDATINSTPDWSSYSDADLIALKAIHDRNRPRKDGG